MPDLFIPIILGTIRKERESEKPAKWLYSYIKKKNLFRTELIDLKEWDLPFLTESRWQSRVDGKYSVPKVQKFSEKIKSADALLIVSPEYNHGYPGVLKNALDWIYEEYNYKPIGIVGVSSSITGGSRMVEQLRLVSIELKMIPIREALYFAQVQNAFDEKGDVIDGIGWEERADRFLGELIWLTNVLNEGKKKVKR